MIGIITSIYLLNLNIHLIPVKTVELHLSYAADYSDDKVLIGASHNIFVGKVIKQVGSESHLGVPKTQFEVQVISNIKGDLNGLVTVDQLGGFNNSTLYTEGKMPLLEPGITYLLTARYNEKYKWYSLNGHSNGWKILSKDNSLGVDELSALSQTDEKVISLRNAYPNEVLLNADIAHKNTRNSFKSLPVEERALILSELEKEGL